MSKSTLFLVLSFFLVFSLKILFSPPVFADDSSFSLDTVLTKNVTTLSPETAKNEIAENDSGATGTSIVETVAVETSDSPRKSAYTFHIQSTVVPQGHPGLTSPYQGNESLKGTGEQVTSFSGTVFMGYRLFRNTEIFINPEGIAGGGVSNAFGLGAYSNGEVNRVGGGTGAFQASIARAYFSQTIPLGDEEEDIGDDQNQIAGKRPRKYLRFSAGKFSLADFLDNNAYAHDQRNQFLNFCFMDNCAWDYSMNPFGYTYALATELKQRDWALRLVFATEPTLVNGFTMDPNIGQAHNIDLEFEQSYRLGPHPGKVRVLVYQNNSAAQSYSALTSILQSNGGVMPSSAGAPGQYNRKTGAGIGFEQELSENTGTFLRAGWNDGQTESWTYTETDMTLAGGASLNGRMWKRSYDHIGIGLGVNGLSANHQAFLSANGQGLMLGDGALRYGPEQFIEAYYSLGFSKFGNFSFSPDVQYILNPGFNQDRGPASIYAVRFHYEWGA